MSKLEKVEIMFENCIGYVVPITSIKELIFEFETVKRYSLEEELEKFNYINFMKLEIQHLLDLECLYDDVKDSFKDRVLQYNDICGITLVYSNNKTKNYSVKWKDYDSQENEWQNTKYENGIIKIRISND